MPLGISKTCIFFKTGTLGCFCFSKGTISQTWDFWKTKAAKSTSFENKKVPKYQFLKYQVAYQAVFKMMSKKKEEKKTENMKKNELSKLKNVKKILILLFLRIRPTRELATSAHFFAIPPRELLLDREGWHNRPFAVHKGLDCRVSSAPSPKRNLSQLPRSWNLWARLAVVSQK